MKNHINVKSILNIINEYYNNKLTKEEKELLYKQSNKDLSIYSLRIHLVIYSYLCDFQGINQDNDVYNILLGS